MGMVVGSQKTEAATRLCTERTLARSRERRTRSERSPDHATADAATSSCKFW